LPTTNCLRCSEVFFGADIAFDDNDSGAFSSSTTSGGTILSSEINVPTAWLQAHGATINGYSFETYIHEIGHGLGHAGNYNIQPTYGIDSHYLNDSTQATVMSYFNPSENTYIDASFAGVVTPMIAGTLSIQNLYGTGVSTIPGNTIYGANSNLGGYMGALFGQAAGEDAANGTLYAGAESIAFTIFDSGDIDTVDLSWVTVDQAIDLRTEGISNVGGSTGNLIIARHGDRECDRRWR